MEYTTISQLTLKILEELEDDDNGDGGDVTGTDSMLCIFKDCC